MTAQVSEVLANEHPDFQPGEWCIYGIIRGTPTEENYGWGDPDAEGHRPKVYQADPGNPPSRMSSNWKGYIEVFRLGPDGRMTLIGFHYDDPEISPLIVNEQLEGDFYLVLKADFEGPRLYVPFRDGLLVLDRSAWLHEDGSLTVDSEIRSGCHPDYPGMPRPRYE